MPTITDLLCRAREAIASSEKALDSANEYFRAAAEDMAAAQKQGMKQRAIADAVGKALSWVNRLLKWHEEGCQGSPFASQSKAARKRKKERSGATEQTKKPATTSEQAQADTERARAQAAKADAAKAKADARKAKADADRAKAEFRKAQAYAKAERYRALYGGGCAQPAIACADRELLVKMLGMLGSDQDGECLNAARKAEMQRKKLDLQWSDLIIPASVAQARAA